MRSPRHDGLARPHAHRAIARPLAIALAVAGSAGCGGGGGKPDPDFGDDGILTIDPGGAGEDDRGRAVLVQPDGRILVAGKRAGDLLMVRRERDGSEDGSFGAAAGTPGYVTTDVNRRSDEGKSLALQPTGEIVLAGISTSGNDGMFVITRYLADGAPDTAYSGDGVAKANFGDRNDEGKAVALQADGKAVMVGQATLVDHDFAVARFDTRGEPDPTFDTDGQATLDFDMLPQEGNGIELVIGGAIVIAGYHGDERAGGQDFALARVTLAGTPDTGFDQDGLVTTVIGPHNDVAFAVAVQPDGKIVLAGVTSDGTHAHCALARYLPTGALDPDFGSGPVAGVVAVTPIGADDTCTALALQADGKIVVAGKTDDGTGDGADFLVLRFEADGDPDPTFDGDGVAVTRVSTGDDGAYAAALDPTTGDIVAAGDSHNGSDYDLAVVRYLD